MRCLTLRRRRWARLAAACGIAGILASPVVTAAPAAAQPPCPPAVNEGGPQPTEIPWHLQRMNPQSVWPLTRGGGVTVAVLDSGVAADHPLLARRVDPGQDFGVGIPDEDGQCDQFYHGTLVAGVIAGSDTVEGVPVRGIAPDATILPGRISLVDEERVEQLQANLAEAITWAVAQDVDIINLSVTSPPSDALAQAIASAVANDIVVVAAIGNINENEQGEESPDDPAIAAYDGVIAVAAVDEKGNAVESPSIPGLSLVDVAAPGTDIWGPMPDGNYARDNGTSFATPIVSGVAALVIAYYREAYDRELTPEQVADRITETADPPPEGRNEQVGHGVVNPYRAVTATLGTRPNLPAGELALPPPEPDPLASARRIAVGGAVAGVVIAGLLLLAPAAVRRGRERRWRPARMP